MLEASVPILTISDLHKNITTARSLERLREIIQTFGQIYLAADVVELSAALPTAPPPPTIIHLPISQTDYSLRLQRSHPFDKDEEALAEIVVTLLATAPPFVTHTQPSPYQLLLLQKASRAAANESQFKAITAVLEQGFANALPQTSGKLLILKQPDELVVQSVLGQPANTGLLAPVIIEGPIAQVIETGKTAVLPNLSPPQLIVPATIKDKVVALLHIFYPETQVSPTIPAGHITFLELFMGYIGAALNSARLLGQGWQRANQLETIYRVTDSAYALQPLEPTLTAIQERLMAAFNASTCYVALLDPDSQTLTFPWFLHHKERLNQKPISLADDNSLVAWVVANNQPYITGDIRADHPPAGNVVVGKSGAPRSIICVPLRDGNDVLGAISIQNNVPHAFDTTEFKTFMAVAAHIAVIIKNAHLYDQTQSLVHQGARNYQTAVALRHAIAAISTSLETVTVLNQLLLSIKTVFAYDTAFTCLYTEGYLRCVANHDFYNRPLSVTNHDLERIWNKSSLLKQIIQSKETRILYEIGPDSYEVSVPGGEVVQSWMGIPLVNQQEILGVLIVYSYQPNTFGKHQIWLAETLCRHTAVALSNARLFQRTQQQLSKLRTLYQSGANMTANLDQESAYQTIVHEMVRALEVDNCTIFIWDKNKRSFSSVAHETVRYSDTKGQPAADGLSTIRHLEKYASVQQLIATQETYSLHRDQKTPADDLALLKTAGMQSILLIPVARRKKVLGVLALGQYNQPRNFHQNELWLARNLAVQAAIAIEHARLFSQAQRHIEELSTFHNIVLQLNTPLHLNTVLDSIAESALKLINANNLHIYLYDIETDTFTFGSALWQDGRRTAAVTSLRSDGLTATVVKNKKPLVINDASSHPLFQSKKASKWGIHAIAGFPLIHSNLVIGAFTVTYVDPHTFSEEELLLLRLLADQAAVAVKNASLFDEAERRLQDMSALVNMAKQVTGNLKLDSVLQTTVQILQGLLNARASTITMLSESGTELIIVAAVGVNPEIMGKARMNLGEGISGEAVKTGEMVYICDAHTEPDFLFFSKHIRSLLAVPLIVRDKAIGTLTVDSDKPCAFSKSDIQLITIAAAQVGVAIANAGLFEEVEERAIELAVAYEELKESDRLKDELVQNVSHELRTPLTFVKGYVDLLLESEMGPLNPEQIEALRIVSTKTDAITRLIEDIVALQRIDSGNLQLELSSLSDFLKTAVASHQIVANQKELTIVYKKPRVKAMVYIDKNRISQVIDNLINNAMKFSPDGGTIIVTVEEQKSDILVAITDHGIGIPDDKQSKVFERFYQVDGSARRRFGGTGIGLALVKRIVEAHQGQVWVESKVDQGSAFYFTLPKANTTSKSNDTGKKQTASNSSQ